MGEVPLFFGPAPLVLTCILINWNHNFQFFHLSPPLMVRSSAAGTTSYSSEHPQCLVQGLAQSIRIIELNYIVPHGQAVPLAGVPSNYTAPL